MYIRLSFLLSKDQKWRISHIVSSVSMLAWTLLESPNTKPFIWYARSVWGCSRHVLLLLRHLLGFAFEPLLLLSPYPPNSPFSPSRRLSRDTSFTSWKYFLSFVYFIWHLQACRCVKKLHHPEQETATRKYFFICQPGEITDVTLKCPEIAIALCNTVNLLDVRT